MYKGTTPVGAPVTAELTLGARAKGPAILAIAWSTGGRSGEQRVIYVQDIKAASRSFSKDGRIPQGHR